MGFLSSHSLTSVFQQNLHSMRPNSRGFHSKNSLMKLQTLRLTFKKSSSKVTYVSNRYVQRQQRKEVYPGMLTQTHTQIARQIFCHLSVISLCDLLHAFVVVQLSYNKCRVYICARMCVHVYVYNICNNHRFSFYQQNNVVGLDII